MVRQKILLHSSRKKLVVEPSSVTLGQTTNTTLTSYSDLKVCL